MKPAVSKYHAANIQLIKTLNPVVRPLFYEFIIRLALAGILIRITSAKRTVAEQLQIWRQGREIPGPIVTNEKGDGSWHCWGLAIDVAPLTFNGLWYSVDNRDSAYEAIAHVAHELTIQWGFALWNFDKPHFMYTGGLTIDQLRNGTAVPPPAFTPCYPTIDPASQVFFTQQRTKLVNAGILPLL